MGIEDQFKDKAQDLNDRAQAPIGEVKEMASGHGQQTQEEEQQRSEQAEGAQDGDES